jgi:hypothetical protein
MPPSSNPGGPTSLFDRLPSQAVWLFTIPTCDKHYCFPLTFLESIASMHRSGKSIRLVRVRLYEFFVACRKRSVLSLHYSSDWVSNRKR